MDYEWISPSRFGPSRPVYKPEFWDKVQELDQWTNKYDPIMTCQPMGIPRAGTPRRIYQTANDITMLYTTSDYGGGNREFRVIPTDNRKHNPQKAIEATYMGYTVGRWEGDTLVLDSISFVDTTWFGRGGLFHSANLHIVEKFTRKGDEILYEITIEDPDVLVEPWVMDAANAAAQPSCRRRTCGGACALRSLRRGRHHHAASTLDSFSQRGSGGSLDPPSTWLRDPRRV